jgi:hypothetical protein
MNMNRREFAGAVTGLVGAAFGAHERTVYPLVLLRTGL